MAPPIRVAALLLLCLACGPGEDSPDDGGPGSDGGVQTSDGGTDGGTDAGAGADAGEDGGSNNGTDGGSDPLPAALALFTASVLGPDSIALSWEPGDEAHTGFELERAPSAAGPFTPVAELGGSARSFVDSGLSSGASYAYRGRARAAAGGSPWSAVVTVMLNQTVATAPDALAALLAVPLSSTALRVSWTVASEAVSVEVERGTTSSGPWVRLGTSAENQLSWDDEGLLPVQTYWYRARAVRGGLASEHTGPVSATTQQVPPPPAPTGLAGAHEVAGSDSNVRLTWTDVPSETRYEVQRSYNNVDWDPLVNVPADATSWIDLSPYFASNYYRLRAVNDGGASAWATTGVYVGPILISFFCQQPTGSSATALSETSVRVTWTFDYLAQCGQAAIERSLSETGPWVELARPYLPYIWPNPVPTSSQYDDTTVTPGTTYFYRVRHLGLSSDWSHSSYTAPVSVTPPSSLGPPGAVTPVVTSSTTVEFTWTDPSNDETGFAVEFATAAGGPFTEAFRVPANTTHTNAQGFSPGTQYWIRVRTLRGAQASAPSAPVSFKTASLLVLKPTADVTVFESTALANAKYERVGHEANSVGCFFNWTNDLGGNIYLFHHCAASLLRFETQPLSGKNVLGAVLKLTPGVLAPHLSSEARYAVFALTGGWNPSTVNFYTLPGRHPDGWAVTPPTNAAASLFNVTEIARKWASGAIGHNGLYVQHFPIVDRMPPGNADYQDQTTHYCSTEQTCGSPDYVPTLFVEYL